jgi:hypothetical protein
MLLNWLLILLSIFFTLNNDYITGATSLIAAFLWINIFNNLYKEPFIRLDEKILEVNYEAMKTGVYLLSEIKIIKEGTDIIRFLHKNNNEETKFMLNLIDLSKTDREDFKRTLHTLVQKVG